MTKLKIALNSNKALLVCLMLGFFLASNAVLASGLSGYYTIDQTKKASGTNYTSFNDADSDLMYGTRASGGSTNGPGITAAVIFNVKPGLYVESLDIPYISGTSASNTITFKGDSSKVTLQWTTGGSYSTPGFVLHLDNTSFIRFDGITMQMTWGSASYSYYDHVVIVDKVSDSNTIKNCVLIGPYISGRSFYGSCIYSGYNYTTYSYSQDQWDSFTNNYMKDAYYGMYWMGSFSSAGAEVGNVITGNTIDSMAYYGAMLEVQDSVIITDNKINMPYGNYGIYTYYLSAISYYGNSYHNLVANNFISVGSSGSPYSNYGMVMYYLDRTDIVYNNINIYGSASTTYGIYTYHYTTASLNILNNSIVNTNTNSTAIALYGGYSSNIWANENYNNLYCGSGNLISYGGTVYTSLSTWSSAGFGFGANDISVNPIYVSNTDLHVNNPGLNAAATPYPGITTDIDGDTRNTTTPDIGADEFTPPAVAPAVTLIVSPSSGFCAGTQDVYVRLFNFGTATLSTATIEWSVDGTAQTAFSWTGTLASAASIDVKVGSYAFSSKTKTYTVVSYPSNGDGTSITSTSRNTATSYVRAGLNAGTYLIDNSGAGTPDYTTLHAAVTDLNLKGLCGAVVFNIANGIYNETAQFGTIPGASSTNTAIFQSKARSSTNVIIDTTWTGTYNNPGHVISFNASSYITFRDITATNSTSGSYADVVDIMNGSNNIILDRNQLIGYTAGYSYSAVVNDFYNTVEHHLTFTNNHISGDYYGLELEGGYGYPKANAEFGLYIYNNVIDSGFGYGIMCEYVDSTTISRNQINYTQTTSYGYAGMYIYNYGVNGTDTLQINNNFVAITGQYSYGMLVYYSQLANIYYNTAMTSNPSTSYYAGYLYNYYTGSTVNVMDNIFANIGGGGAIGGNSNGMTNSDYNDFYSTGSLGNWAGTSCSTLADWQGASAMDANSVSGDPKVNSFYSGDLHLTCQSKIVSHTGIAIGGYITDIDSQKRTAVPCMGADETLLYSLDASVESIDSPAIGFCAGTKNVWVTFKNRGTGTITSCTINWQVNGTTMTSYSWTGSLAFNATAQIKLGSVSFASGTAKKIVAWTSGPNGGIDMDACNDSSTRSVSAGLTGTYTIDNTGATADFTSFRAAVASLNNSGICGAVTLNVASSYYNESIIIGNIIGSSATNTVTFQSKSGVAANVILDTTWATWSGRGHVVRLNGASNIIFSKITMTNYGSSGYGDVLELATNASYNKVDGCEMYTSTSMYSNYGAVIYDDYSSIEQYNVFSNDVISGSFYGVQLNAPYGKAEYGNVVSGCQVDSQSEYGIYSYYQDSLSIIGNTIYQPTAYYGIFSYYNTASGTGSDTTLIANNFITLGTTNYGYAIMGYYNDMMNIYYNSVNVSTSYGYCVYMYHYSTGKIINFYNNSFNNDNSGYVAYMYNIGASDFNNYYSAGSSWGTWSGSSITSLTDIQSASGMDLNSVSNDPAYNSPSTGDLHATSLSTVLKAAGVPLTLVTTDIDGQTRGTKHSDIGADEFSTIIPDDLGVSAILSPSAGDCGSANTMVEVKIHNHGSNSENNYGVKVVVTAAGKTYTATRTKTNAIATSADDTAWFTMTPALNTSKGGTFYVKAYTMLSGDGDHTNDTDSAAIIMVAPPKASFTIAKTSICLGDTFKVKDASTFSGSPTYSYILVDSKGNTVATASTASPAITYSTAGSYRIKLTITASCSDTTSMACTINVNPTASFTYNKACAKDTTKFDGSASTAGSGATLSTYAWSFGDGNTASTVSPTNFYKNGTYPITVTFKVTNSFGCSNTATKSFNIDTLNASFTSKVAKDGTASFAANDKTFANYSWNYGDTSAIISGSSTTSSYKYMKNNIYKSTLTVTNAAGCKNSWSTTDTVLITGISEAVAGNFSMKIYPNPFKDNTNISYTLEKPASVKVEVWDVMGRSIATLVDHSQNEGNYNVSFKASEYNTGAGIYIVKMTIGDQIVTKQIILTK